jgi:hypothetical protein
LEGDSLADHFSWPLNRSLVDVPSLVLTIVAVPEDHVSVLGVGFSMDIKALSSNVSDVSVGSVEPKGSLGVVSSVLSDGSSDSNSELVSSLVGNSVVSSGPGSDGLGSPVEGPPLSVVQWVVGSDSKSELVSSDVLVPEEGSSVFHLRLDLELDTVGEWVSWILGGLGVDVPGLVQSIVAVVEDGVSVVGVGVSVDIQALTSQVSEVSSGSFVEEDFLIVRVSPWSDDGSVVDSESSSVLVGDGLSSITGGSDGFGSGIEHEPLSWVPWLVVVDSQSVLVVTNVLVPEEGSSASHHGSDLESDSVSEWVSLWNLDSSGVDSPSLSGVVLVPVPVNVVVVVVSEGSASNNDVTPVLNVLGTVEEGSLVDRVSPWSGDDLSSGDQSLGSDQS